MVPVWIAAAAVVFLNVFSSPVSAAPREKGNPYFKTCRYRGRFWDECVQNVGQDLQPQFAEGIPELGVRPIDPLFVDGFNFSEASGKFRINLQVTNVTMTGFKNYEVTGVRSNLQELTFEFRLRVPFLNFRSLYHMDGRFLFLAISGGGICQYNFTDVDNRIVVNGHLARRVSDDALHYRVASLQWTMLATKGSSHFSNLEGETSLYSYATSRLLNQHAGDAWTSFQRAAELAFAEVLRERINRLMMNIPYRDLFPPGVLPLHLLEQPMADNQEDEYPPIHWVRPTTTSTTTPSTTSTMPSTTSTTTRTSTTSTMPSTTSTTTSTSTTSSTQSTTSSTPSTSTTTSSTTTTPRTSTSTTTESSITTISTSITTSTTPVPETTTSGSHAVIESVPEDKYVGELKLDHDNSGNTQDPNPPPAVEDTKGSSDLQAAIQGDGEGEEKRIASFDTDYTLDDVHIDATTAAGVSPSQDACRECDEVMVTAAPPPLPEEVLIGDSLPDKRDEYTYVAEDSADVVVGGTYTIEESPPINSETIVTTKTTQTAVADVTVTVNPTQQTKATAPSDLEQAHERDRNVTAASLNVSEVETATTLNAGTYDSVELEEVTDANNLIPVEEENLTKSKEDSMTDYGLPEDHPETYKVPDISRGPLLTTSLNVSTDFSDDNATLADDVHGDEQDASGDISLSVLGLVVSEAAKFFIAEATEGVSKLSTGVESSNDSTPRPI